MEANVGAWPAGSGWVQTRAHMVFCSAPAAPPPTVAKRVSMTEIRQTKHLNAHGLRDKVIPYNIETMQ